MIICADDEADRKKKKKTKVTGEETRLVSKMQSKFAFDSSELVKPLTNTSQLDGNNTLKEDVITDLREVRSFIYILLSVALFKHLFHNLYEDLIINM